MSAEAGQVEDAVTGANEPQNTPEGDIKPETEKSSEAAPTAVAQFKEEMKSLESMLASSGDPTEGAELIPGVNDYASGAIMAAADVQRRFSLGRRPNGDFGVVLTIPEYYVQSVQDFAEHAKQTVEEWCSQLFASTIEAYCKPTKGR